MTHSLRPRGYILLFALIASAALITISAGLISYFTSYVRSEHVAIASTQSLDIAEAGIDKAAYELNANSNYTGETGTALGSGTLSISVTSIDGSTKRITATAYVPNSTNPVATKEVRENVSINSAVISFRYGVQTGTGGFSLTGGSTINGSVYSNGNIVATNGVHITGAAVAADPPALAADQVNNTPTPISSCTSSTCVTFADTTATQDFAQSFKLSTAEPLNNIQFYIKKVSTPSDATVRIVNDNGGAPGTDVLMTGTLAASTVSTSFGWVSVTLPTTPILDPSQTYWIVIDASANSSKYYIIGTNSGGYANGTAMIGRYGTSWSATTPSGLDGYFQIYLGGGTSTIGGDTNTGGVYIGTTASDDAWAHTVTGATVTGTIYCQSGNYISKTCNTSRADPTAAALPLSDSNITDWKNDALAGSVHTGDITIGSSGATLGPEKIVGNLTVGGGGTLTVSGTLWVTGIFTVSGGSKVKLASSYGANDGIIVTDGYVSLVGGSSFAGSGTTGSYPFVITTSACPAESGCNGNNAIYLSGGAGTVALIAQNGTAEIDGGSNLKAVTAQQIVMLGGASLTYDSGLISANFSSGPGGSWAVVPGTYAITK